jgi:O-antigen/teichoic acid export membrane protein
MIHIQSIIQKLKSSNLFKDSFWALFGNTTNKGLALIAGIVIARFLGRDIYGEYGVIKNTLLYIAVFSSFGMGFSVTKFIAQYLDKDKSYIPTIVKSAYKITLTFSCIMALVLIAFTEQICDFIDLNDGVDIIRYTAITVIFNAIVACQTGMLAGFKRFKVMAYINVISGIATFISSVIFTYYWGLAGAILALAFSNLLNSILNAIGIEKIIKSLGIATPALQSMVGTMMRFSIPIALQECLYSISCSIGMLVLVKLSNYGEVGLNSAAAQWASVVLFIPGVLQNVMLSYLSSAVEETNHKSMLKRMMAINFTTAMVPFVIVLCCTPLIVSFYGDSFTGLGLVLNTAVAATVFRCLIQVLVQEYISKGKTWSLFAIRLGRDIIAITISYLLIKHFDTHAAFFYNFSVIISSLLCLLTLLYFNKNEHSTILKKGN